jgi:hypothetical protein
MWNMNNVRQMQIKHALEAFLVQCRFLQLLSRGLQVVGKCCENELSIFLHHNCTCDTMRVLSACVLQGYYAVTKWERVAQINEEMQTNWSENPRTAAEGNVTWRQNGATSGQTIILDNLIVLYCVIVQGSYLGTCRKSFRWSSERERGFSSYLFQRMVGLLSEIDKPVGRYVTNIIH